MSGGDYFLIDNHLPPKSEVGDALLKVELLTKRALLSPRNILEQSTTEEELSKSGINIDVDEEVVSISDQDHVALIVVPRDIITRLEEIYPNQYEFTTPLLQPPVSDLKHMTLDVSNNLATIKIYNNGGGLEFVDIYDASSSALILYWIQRLSQIKELESSSLYIYRCEYDLSRLLSKNFKKIMYANNKRSI